MYVKKHKQQAKSEIQSLVSLKFDQSRGVCSTVEDALPNGWRDGGVASQFVKVEILE